MAGAHQLMLGSGGGIVSTISCSAESTAAGAGSSTASVTFGSDGTIGGGSTFTGSTNWYRPAITGIGSQFWISINGGAWTSLSTNPQTSLAGTNNSVNRSISIAADSGGSNVVATGTVNLTVSNQQ